MLIAQIKRIHKLTPIEPGSSDDLNTDSENQESLHFSTGEKRSDRAEKGKAIVDIKLIGGKNVSTGEDIWIISTSPIKAKLLQVEKSFPGEQKFELYFDQTFIKGFEYTIKHFLFEGGGLIGLSAEEMTKLDDIEIQEQVFNHLADITLNTKKDEIKGLALPCFILKAFEHGDMEKSHFVGLPKLEQGTELPKNAQDTPLLHLASIKFNDIKSVFTKYAANNILPNLTFYLDIENTENGWPEMPDHYKVLNYSDQIEIDANQNSEPAFGMVFKETLDIPRYDHSALQVLNLTAEEKGRYAMLEATFKALVRPQEGENNKLFGYPDNVQHCVAYEAERIKSAREYTDDIYKDAVEWQLLLQVSPYAHWFKFFDKFGDGAIYYMIQKDDLQKGNFENIQVVVQNT